MEGGIQLCIAWNFIVDCISVMALISSYLRLYLHSFVATSDLYNIPRTTHDTMNKEGMLQRKNELDEGGRKVFYLYSIECVNCKPMLY